MAGLQGRNSKSRSSKGDGGKEKLHVDRVDAKERNVGCGLEEREREITSKAAEAVDIELVLINVCGGRP